MSDPTYVGQNNYGFICDRAPTISEPIIDELIANIGLDTSNWLFNWWNQTNNTNFLCVDQTAGAMVWQQLVTA